MKKFLRRSSLLFMLLFMLNSFGVYVSAAPISPAESLADSIMIQFGTYERIGSTPLYNAAGEREATCYTYLPTGYVIINENDLSVPEFSPENDSPFVSGAGVEKFIYGGPVSYYAQTTSETTIDLTTRAIVTDIPLYSREPLSAAEQYARVSNNTNATRASLSYMTRHRPCTFASSYYCGLDGSAIVLRYLHDYHDTDLLPSNALNSPQLQAYLINGRYIPDTGTTGANLVEGVRYNSVRYTGLNQFLTDRGSSIRASNLAFTNSRWEMFLNSFTNDYPVLLGTVKNFPMDQYSNHWLIAYGYFYQDLSGGHIIVNDGFGSNGIYVTADIQYYGQIILFS